MKFFPFIISLVFIFSSIGQSEFQSRLVGGIVAGERFPAVFLFSENRKNFTESFCTAAKIGPNLFLTAAHCVLDTGAERWYFPDSAKPGRKLYYSFGRDLKKPEPLFELIIRKVSIHPLLLNCLNKGKYFPAQCHLGVVPTPDIAIIRVEEGTGPFFEASRLPLDFSVNRPGDEIVLVGYGAQNDGDTSPPLLKYGYSKVATREEIWEAVKNTSAEESGFINEGFFFGSLGPLAKEGFPNLGSGDSGGPVLKEFPDRIVGINSSAVCYDDAPADCEVTSNNFFTRIDSKATIPLNKWIQSILSVSN